MVLLHSLIMGMLFPWCLVAGAAHGADGSGYAIVVTENTAADSSWAEVVTTLAAKHAHRGVTVLRHDGDVTGVGAALTASSNSPAAIPLPRPSSRLKGRDGAIW